MARDTLTPAPSAVVRDRYNDSEGRAYVITRTTLPPVWEPGSAVPRSLESRVFAARMACLTTAESELGAVTMQGFDINVTSRDQSEWNVTVVYRKR